MTSAPFRLTTLGRLALADAEGVEEPSLATRRRKLALLVVLAVSRKPLTRDALIELFWGDQPEERARHSLSDALSHVRRVLGPESITTRRADVTLAEGTPLEVDIVALHTAAKAQRWSAVVSIYGGPFLDGVHVPDSARFDQWMSTQRATAERLFVTACRNEVARLRAAREWGACLEIAVKWAELVPHEAEAAEQLRTAQRERGAPEGVLATASRSTAPTMEAAPAAGPTPAPNPATGSAVSAHAATATPAPRRAMPRRMRWSLAAAVLVLLAMGAAAVRWSEADAAPSMGGRRQPITTRSAEARRLYVASFATPDLRGEAPDAIAKLEAAIALDSSFAMAWQRLAWNLDGDESQRARVHDALTRARDASDSVTEYERQIILGGYHMLVSGDLARAAGAYRAALAIEPRNVSTWHRLGMVYQYLGDDRRAAEAYAAANRISPTSAARWINLVDVRFAGGDTAGAARAIDSMALHLPGHASVFVMSANLAAATGDLDRARREVRAYLTSAPSDQRIQAFGRMYRSRIQWTAGQLDAGDADARDAMHRNLLRGDSVWALRDGLALAQATAWLRHDRSAARRVLRETLARVPLAALPVLDRPWLDFAIAAAIAGDTATARAALDAYAREIPAHLQAREEGPRHHADGIVALVERRYDDAVRHLEQAAFPECRICGLPELGLAHEALGDTTAARRVWTEYLETPTLRRTDVLDALHLRWVRARLDSRKSARRPSSSD